MVEDIEKLGTKLKAKQNELKSLLKEYSAKTTQQHEVQVSAPISIEDLQDRSNIINEMQLEVLEKKTGLEKALRETQQVAKSIQELNIRFEKGGDVIPAIKALQVTASEKREALEKAIKEMNDLKERYEKKFHR